MASDLISCIIPVYNGERYLPEALDSILQQTWRPLEIIVADDGSTDGTADLVAAYGHGVCYLRQPNAGPPSARNLGLGAARGDFVAFLDADDRWHPEKLMRQMARFQAQPKLDASVTHIQNFWVPELAEEEAWFRDHRLSKPQPGYLTQTLLARHRLFEEVGPFDIALQHADSSEWFLRASGQGAVIELMPEVLVYRRMHPASFSRSGAAVSRDQYLRLAKSVLDGRRRRPQPTQDPSNLAVE